MGLCAPQVKKLLTNGTGEFDEEAVRHQWPQALSLTPASVQRVVAGETSKRKRDMLVQGVANLRRKEFDKCVQALNNLVACTKVGAQGFCATVFGLCIICGAWLPRQKDLGFRV